MKIVAYCALHYGKPYLAYAIRSVIDAVDEFHVLYADKPSHGSPTTLVCPDTETELHDIAGTAAGGKLRWHKGNWRQENEQRNSIAEYAPDVDVILIVDSDEVWNQSTLAFLEDNLNFSGGFIRIPFYHVYRDFHHAVIHDPASPPRILFPRHYDQQQSIVVSLDYAIAHFGYCQPVEYLRYKLGIHGHKHELHYTPEQYVNLYLDRTRWHDLHPVGSEYWNAEAVNPLDIMPAFMKEHPYWGLDMVK